MQLGGGRPNNHVLLAFTGGVLPNASKTIESEVPSSCNPSSLITRNCSFKRTMMKKGDVRPNFHFHLPMRKSEASTATEPSFNQSVPIVLGLRLDPPRRLAGRGQHLPRAGLRLSGCHPKKQIISTSETS